jgi:hypothetical protein
MFELKLDVKKFLSLPLNDGTRYFDFSGTCGYITCGCIKGNFSLCSNTVSIVDSSKTYPLSLADVLEYILPISLYTNQFDRQIHFTDPILGQILNRAEDILRTHHRPQYAKLFLIRALRMGKYIPQDTEVPAGVKICQTV